MTDRVSAVSYRILGARARLFGLGDGDSLENVNTTPLPNGSLCWVVDQPALYALHKDDNTTPPSGTAVIAPGSGPGRWFLLVAGGAALAVHDWFDNPLPPRQIIRDKGYVFDNGTETVFDPGFIDARIFGVKGDSGITDNTPFFQAAVDAAGDLGGGLVYVPGLQDGNYYGTTRPIWMRDNVWLVGDGDASWIHNGFDGTSTVAAEAVVIMFGAYAPGGAVSFYLDPTFDINDVASGDYQFTCQTPADAAQILPGEIVWVCSAQVDTATGQAVPLQNAMNEVIDSDAGTGVVTCKYPFDDAITSYLGTPAIVRVSKGTQVHPSGRTAKIIKGANVRSLKLSNIPGKTWGVFHFGSMWECIIQDITLAGEVAFSGQWYGRCLIEIIRARLTRKAIDCAVGSIHTTWRQFDIAYWPGPVGTGLGSLPILNIAHGERARDCVFESINASAAMPLTGASISALRATVRDCEMTAPKSTNNVNGLFTLTQDDSTVSAEACIIDSNRFRVAELIQPVVTIQAKPGALTSVTFLAAASVSLRVSSSTKILVGDVVQIVGKSGSTPVNVRRTINDVTRTTVTAPSVASTTLQLADTTGIVGGDLLQLIYYTTGNTATDITVTVLSVTDGTHVELTAPTTISSGAQVYGKRLTLNTAITVDSTATLYPTTDIEHLRNIVRFNHFDAPVNNSVPGIDVRTNGAHVLLESNQLPNNWIRSPNGLVAPGVELRDNDVYFWLLMPEDYSSNPTFYSGVPAETEFVIYTITVPEVTGIAPGDSIFQCLDFEMWGTYGNNAGTGTLRLYDQANTLQAFWNGITGTAGAAQGFHMRIHIEFRLGNSQFWIAECTYYNGNADANWHGSAYKQTSIGQAIDLTAGPYTLELRGIMSPAGGAGGDAIAIRRIEVRPGVGYYRTV